ncbi:MAG: thioredoxin family protein [Bacteroidales bacterium]|nr:thioredoxin family protein [Bacteroidales bacterium]
MKSITVLLISMLTMVLAYSQDGYTIGAKADDFKLKNVDGSFVQLSDYSAEKGVVVIFSCNHCPYVKAYEDRMIELHNTFAPKGFPIIAINSNDPEIQPNDSFDKMIVRAKEKSFPFKYVLDNDHKVQEAFGAKKTPHVYLLQKKDKDFVVKYIGTIDDSPRDESAVQEKYLENAINALLKGNKPDPNVTKAIGCSIKKKKA